MARLDPIAAGWLLLNYLTVMTLACQTIARACGKCHVHNREPEDLCALTMEAAAMAKVSLARTNRWPGRGGFSPPAPRTPRHACRARRRGGDPAAVEARGRLGDRQLRFGG